jgi:Protein of unknown function (DUF2934)
MSTGANMTSKTKVLHARPKASRVASAQSPMQAAARPAEIGEPARQTLISEAAYYRAEKRGFAPGQELDDWFAAEAEVTGMSLLRDLQPETH